MKQLKIALVFLLSMVSQFAKAENFLSVTAWNTARHTVDAAIELCLNNASACRVQPAEIKILSQIARALPQEKPLEFVSARRRPDLFNGSGTHRVAVTGNKVGDPIYINSDEIESTDYFVALAILTHELGHHHGVTDSPDRVLDILGGKVGDYFKSRSEILSWGRYNQPSLGVILAQRLNSKAGGSSSVLLVFDRHGVIDILAKLEKEIGCPVGSAPKGGIFVNQLRDDGPYDWNPETDGQDFGFRFQISNLCVPRTAGGPEEIQLLTGRYAVRLIPESGPPTQGWWKTREGRLEAIVDSEVIENGYTYPEVFHRAGSGLPLKVISLKSAEKNLTNGSEWSVESEVESPAPMDFESCAADFTSPTFYHYSDSPRAILAFESCELKKLSATRYLLKFMFHFPQKTVSREYLINSIQLKVKDENLILFGFPVFSESIQLKSNQTPTKPLSIVQAHLIGQGPDGKPFITHPNLDFSRPSSFKVKMGEMFAVQLVIQSESEISPRSSLSLGLEWIERGETQVREYGFAIFLRDSFKYGWMPPLNGGTQMLPHPQAPEQFIFQTSLRTMATSGKVAGNKMNLAYFGRIWLMNQSLQEVYQYLDIEVKTEN